jgi:hypothetical protein
MKIDQEDFNRKAQHILDTVVKPQVEKYEQSKKLKTMKLNQEDRREEVAAYTTMFIVGALSIVLIGVLLKTLFNLF